MCIIEDTFQKASENTQMRKLGADSLYFCLSSGFKTDASNFHMKKTQNQASKLW